MKVKVLVGRNAGKVGTVTSESVSRDGDFIVYVDFNSEILVDNEHYSDGYWVKKINTVKTGL